MSESAVPIDYTSRDYAALRTDLINAIPSYLPEWTSRSESDFGIVLIELFSYVGDVLGYYIDRVANEAFITTAVQRASVLSLAQMIDYTPGGLAAASTTLSFTISSSVGSAVTIPAGTRVSTVPELDEDPVIFETDSEITIAIGGTDTVTATEGQTREEPTANPVGVSDGSSDQVFSLYYSDIIENSLTVWVDEDGDGSGLVEWRSIDHLIDAEAEDRVYSTTTDENGVTYLVFGDDVNGRIPTQGAFITAEYRTGVGTDGNVGANTLVELIDAIAGVDSVTNTSNATGGEDAESIASIRKQAPRSLRTLERAVTLDDYALLAEKVPGVLHASATSSVYTSVTLYIAPTGGGAPSQALKDSVENDLADKKMINTTITMADPTYIGVDVTVNPLHVLPQYNRSDVELAVQNAISEVFAIDSVDFGYRVTLSHIYSAIQNVEGVDYAVVTELHESTGSGLGDVVAAANEIPEEGTVAVTSTGGLVGS